MSHYPVEILYGWLQSHYQCEIETIKDKEQETFSVYAAILPGIKD